jgi:hypothetical protein
VCYIRNWRSRGSWGKFDRGQGGTHFVRPSTREMVRSTGVPERGHRRRYHVGLDVREDDARSFDGGATAFVDDETHNCPVNDGRDYIWTHPSTLAHCSGILIPSKINYRIACLLRSLETLDPRSSNLSSISSYSAHWGRERGVEVFLPGYV